MKQGKYLHRGKQQQQQQQPHPQQTFAPHTRPGSTVLLNDVERRAIAAAVPSPAPAAILTMLLPGQAFTFRHDIRHVGDSTFRLMLDGNNDEYTQMFVEPSDDDDNDATISFWQVRLGPLELLPHHDDYDSLDDESTTTIMGCCSNRIVSSRCQSCGGKLKKTKAD